MQQVFGEDVLDQLEVRVLVLNFLLLGVQLIRQRDHHRQGYLSDGRRRIAQIQLVER